MLLLAALSISLATAPDGQSIYAARSAPDVVLRIDLASRRVTSTIALPAPPGGIAVWGESIWVAAGDFVFPIRDGKLGAGVRTGRGACSPILNLVTGELSVCNRFDGTVAFLDPAGKVATKIVPVGREPYAAAMAPSGKELWVACHLPEQPAIAAVVAAKVAVVDAVRHKVMATIQLPNGSTGVRGIAISPDGKYAFVTHILARYTVHTSQLEQGWVNTNALSIVDVRRKALCRTVLLDDVDDGAANPWAVAMGQGGSRLYVTHAGTNEVSVIDVAPMLDRLTRFEGDPENQLSLLYGVRRRIALPGKGPRALAFAGGRMWVAEEFSDTLAGIADEPFARVTPISLPARKQTDERRGEALFHDATWCFQRWQSCSSCHPDGRADGLNWDLLNDGIGSPKNTRTLLYSHLTGAAMWTGVRPDAKSAIRSGMRHILFLSPDEPKAKAIESYLRSLQAVAGAQSPAVERGKKLFFRSDVGCAACHPPPLYTDGKLHDVGTTGNSDFGVGSIAQRQFMTPTLLEVWRTAPYLHDGRFVTLEDAVTRGNHNGRRGNTSHLSPGQLRDLCDFLRSLGTTSTPPF